MQYGHCGQAGGAEAGEVAEHAPGVGPVLHGEVHEVGAGALYQVNQRQFLAQGDLLDTEGRGYGGRRIGTGPDTAVVGPDHTAHTTDKTDAHDHAGARHAGIRVVIRYQVIGQCVQPQKGHARVEQQCDALMRTDLPPLFEGVAALVRGRHGACLETPETIDKRQHLPPVLLKGR